jgi:hypothetical protein
MRYVIPGLIRNPLFSSRCRFRIKPEMMLPVTFHEFITINILNLSFKAFMNKF